MTDWQNMKPRDFDATAKDVQEALFAVPDAFGTPDLFDGFGD